MLALLELVFITEGIAFFTIRLFLEILLIPIPIKLTTKVAQIDTYVHIFFLMTSENVTMGETESLSGNFYT